MKIFVGIKEKAQPTIFESNFKSSKETHPQFDIIYGPFKSKEEAETYIKAMDCWVACGEG